MRPDPDSAETLAELATQCLREGPSRRLDGEIYCAIHALADWNDLGDELRVSAREEGYVLVAHDNESDTRWVEAPPFTSEMKYAESLMPQGLAHIAREPRIVCATALSARARAGEPPFRHCRWPDSEAIVGR
jgi:hypothetical protein